MGQQLQWIRNNNMVLRCFSQCLIAFARLCRLVLRPFLLLAILPLGAAAADEELDLRYKVQAAYLYQFTKFVQWDEAALGQSDAPFVLCLRGGGDFGDYLKPLAERSTKGRNIIIRDSAVGEGNSPCHVLFIDSSEEKLLGQYLEQFKAQPTLTVSDAAQFVERGGMIGFVVDKGKVRISVNLAAARAANLSISAKLLEVAQQVLDSDPDGGGP